MARAPIIAGKSVIVVQVQDAVDKALTRISSRLRRFSSQVNRLGFEAFSGGLFGSLATLDVTRQFKEFEDIILFLSTKLKGTEKDMQRIEATIRQLGRTTSFTAKEVGEAAVVLGQAGFKAAQVSKILQPTLDLARGARIELSAAGEILANTLRSFSLDGSKAAEVAGQFIAASRSGTLTVIDLKESIKEVLGTVRKLNIDLPTTLALITQLSERSLKGTKAGTSLNTALLNLASKGGQLKSLLGIDLPNNLDGDSYIIFLEKLRDTIAGLGNRQQVAILQRLFNIRGGRAITALDDIDKIIAIRREIRDAGDEARVAAKKMDSGFGGSIRRATSALESMRITLGSLLGKALIPFTNEIPKLTAALETLANVAPNLTIGLLSLPVIVLGAGAAMLTTSFIASKLAGIFASFIPIVGVLGNHINKVFTRFFLLFRPANYKNVKSIGGAFRVAAISIRRFVFSGTGILILLEGLLLFGPRIELINQAFKRMTTGITSAFRTIFGVFSKFNGAIRIAKDGLDELAAGNGQAGISLIKKALENIGVVIKNTLVSAWQDVVIAIAPVYDTLVALKKTLKQIIDLITVFFKSIQMGMAQLGNVKGVGSLIKDLTLITASFTRNMNAPALGVISDLTDKVEEAKTSAQGLQKVASYLGRAFDKMTKPFEKIENNFAKNGLLPEIPKMTLGGNYFSNQAVTDGIVKGLTGFDMSMGRAITDVVGKGYQNLGKAALSVASGVTDLTTGVRKGITEQINAMLSIAKAGAKIFTSNSIEEFVVNSLGLLKEMVKGVLVLIKQMVTGVLQTLITLRTVLANVLQAMSGPLFGDLSKAANMLLAGVPQLQQDLQSTNNVFNGLGKILDKSFELFADNLRKIFSVSIIPDAQDKKNKADAAAAAANAAGNTRADKIARAQRGPSKLAPTPLGFLPTGSTALQTNETPLQKKLKALQDKRDTLVYKRNMFRAEQERKLDKVRGSFLEPIVKEGARLQRNEAFPDFRKNVGDLSDQIRKTQRAIRLDNKIQPFPQKSRLEDIVATTVGSYSATRGNLLKVAGGDKQDKANDLLSTIVDNTGGAKDSLEDIKKQGLGTFK